MWCRLAIDDTSPAVAPTDQVDDRGPEVRVGSLGIVDAVPGFKNADKGFVGDVFSDVHIAREKRREPHHVCVAQLVELAHADVAVESPRLVPAARPSLTVAEPPLVNGPVTTRMTVTTMTRPTLSTRTSLSTSMAHRPSSRKAPVAPRRATKIDPDGTLDPYR